MLRALGPTNRGSFPGAQTFSGVSTSIGTGEGFPRPKWPEREVDYFSTYSAEVKNLSSNVCILGAYGDSCTLFCAEVRYIHIAYKRNNEAPSREIGCCGKAVSIKRHGGPR